MIGAEGSVSGAGAIAVALEREHRLIDGGIDDFLASDRAGDSVDGLVRTMAGLRRHIYLEETFLFPPLQARGLMMPIQVMLREHGQLWDSMQQIDRLLVAAGAAAESVTTQCRRLLALLDAHNLKEEPVIYPQADAVCDEHATAQLQLFLSSGETPPGWVCARATDPHASGGTDR